MVIAVKSRPNHYEVLGLSPAASDDEIAQAFARQMRFPHPTAELAQIGIAYDTLRNPAKRRSYDEALGLRPEPQPVAAPPAMSFRISARLVALASPGPIEPPPAAEPSQRRALPTGGVIAAKARSTDNFDAPLRDDATARAMPVRTTMVGGGRTMPARSGAAVRARPAIEDIFQLGDAGGEGSPAGLSRNALALGALLVTVVVIGAWAGAHAQDSGRADAGPALVASKPHHRVQASAAQQDPNVAAQDWRPAAAPKPVERIRRPSSDAPSHSPQARLADIGQSLAQAPIEGQSIESSGDRASSPPPGASPEAAALPLPKEVIVRTIERIGYSCGEVASATAAGSPDAYKITCTSGQSYQAKPVRGRYHFRRW